MSTSAVVIIGANSAILVGPIAKEAKIATCKIVDKNFDAREATISQKQEYSRCIKELYPAPIDPGVIIILKVLFIIWLLSAIVGGYREYKETYTNWSNVLMSSLLYGLGIPLLILGALIIIKGILWVLGI